MPKLTKQIIDSHEKKEKMYTVWDTEVKGFGCRIQPSGKKVYVFFYRMPRSHKLQYLTVGVHGSITPEVAREIVKGYSADVARGMDPKSYVPIKTEEKTELPFKDFFKVFHERHRKIYYKSSTLRNDEYNIKKWIMPFFGEKILSEISTKDILYFKDSMKSKQGAYNRSFNTVRSIFNQAELWEYIPKKSNPCANITKYPEKKMERFLSNFELQKLESVLQSEEIKNSTSSYVINAIQMLIYTGCRKGEILSLKWEDVHLEESYLHLKDSKTGERIIPLNDISKGVLSNIIPKAGNPYVFAAEKGCTHIVNILTPWNSIRKMINCEDVRIHDLRHSYASFCIKKGIDIFRVAKLLGHKDVKTTMRYAHISKEDMISASNVVGEMFGNG